jgi:YVTN family beta-propeller protein
VSATTESLIGRDVLGYRVEGVAGRGGMGVVYRAYDPRLKRTVALKLIVPELAADEGFRDRFVRESQLAASLDHPSIVPVFAAGEDEGRLFIAMRYVEGSDLARLLRAHGALEPARALAYCAQIGDALDSAHERGLVHGDVKPSNVLIDRRDHCYLADFGLTRRLSDQPGAATGPTMGTAAYAAPERIRGEEVGPAADVYSLGCLFYECLTGEQPFTKGSDFAVLFAHLEEAPPAASQRRPALGADIDAVVSRALAKEPFDRFDSCGALLAAAHDALGVASSRPQFRTVMVAAVAAVLVALAGLLAFLLSRGGESAAALGGLVVRIDPATNSVAGTASVGEGPTAVAADPNGVWVAAYREGTLWRINPRTLATTRVPSIGVPQDLAAYRGTVYVGGDGPRQFAGNIAAYDAGNGRRIDGLDLASCVGSLNAGPAGVWVAPCPFLQRVSFVPQPHIVRTVYMPWATPHDAEHDLSTLNDTAVGKRSVWVLGDALDRRLWRIDGRSGQILATFHLPFPPMHLALGAGSVWVTDELGDVVVRVDPGTGRVVVRIPIGKGASGVAFGRGSVWATSFLDGTVSRIDPRTNRVTSTIRVGGAPRDVAIGAGSVWTAGDAS